MINPFSLLRWVYLGRIAIAVGIFTAMLVAWRDAAPADTLVATLVLIFAVGFTLASFWYASILRAPVDANFLYAQVVFDTLMITAVVHVSGGPESEFAPLYILVIAAGALLLPIPGGILVGALASILYIGDIVWWYTAVPPAPALIQIALFAVVALLTGLLGDRLRRTGRMLTLMESELRQLRLDTSDILREIDTGVVTVDGRGRLAYANLAAEAMLGVPVHDWLNRPVLEELDDRLAGLGETMRRTERSGVPVSWFETRPRVPVDDRVFGVRTTLLDRDGEPWVTAVIQDITDGKKVEDLNRRADRLQAVAELAASMAHEIKNPLASIRSAVEQLTRSRLSTDDKVVLEDLVLAESDRLSRLLAQFIEFSRVEVRHMERVELAEVCKEAIVLARQHPDAGQARVDFEPPARPLEVSGDADLLHRAVFNLVLNACQFAGEDGWVSVRADRVAGRDLPPGLELSAAARVKVADSGPGISAEDAGRIFDPFFTRRAGGSGLGLALVHRAIEAHRGMILVGNGPSGGAEFAVYLPTVNGGGE